MAVMNRKIDSDILTELATGTVHCGASGVTASIGLVLRAKTILGNSGIPWDGKETDAGQIFRSDDGGDTWRKITSGLPGGDIGRIGLAVSRFHKTTA